ncbi:aconitase family protein [Podospora appendiculata]|uniref:Aconitase family protein n=1 Tax=Podospora appendiculata TaxID=314037 RepID=A0AAE0XFK0_9PEZI|nr:aconitase family protein [Podospora appendiculata]
MPTKLDDSAPSDRRLVELLRETRGIQLADISLPRTNILSEIEHLSNHLRPSHPREADALQQVHQHCTTPPHFGGLGLPATSATAFTAAETAEVLFLVSAYLEALTYQDRNASPLPVLPRRPPDRRGMTLAEKILAAHDVARTGHVAPGDVLRLDVDWVMASELSWSAMEKTYDALGQPGIFRNDRLWIAGDHVVDPRAINHPRIRPLIEACERARRVFKLTEYQGMNYTIMHTEFCRERAQPGMLVVGSDSHTCSAGSVSSLAIGLGVADVTLPLVTGETWIKVPETVKIRFVNRPRPGLGGKDIILYILKELRRNTVAADRVVEYGGPGMRYLSCDASTLDAVEDSGLTMKQEFGGVTGICVPDEVTHKFINGRKQPKHKKQAIYYRPDDDAHYAEEHTIDLDKIEPFVARYPSPDDVVPVGDVAGTRLDGVFIGACTTAREDLVLAALTLEAGLKRGMKPVAHGKRKVVPGSRPILHDLEERGLADIYRQAGFEVGVPGCSYCVGMSVDKAAKGEVWLSSQNRNFENRMGPGAIGSIASAVTVAASSFDMSITDPTTLLDDIDLSHLADILGGEVVEDGAPVVQYVEPGGRDATGPGQIVHLSAIQDAGRQDTTATSERASPSTSISGKVHTLGDFIDTDALAPAEFLVGNPTAPEIGRYCLYHTDPDFRRRVKDDGLDVVVAGKAFGVGSSRENAVLALQGAGVQCVIARSFAFIFARNMPNLGLLGIVVEDDDFYRLARDGFEIAVDVDGRTVKVGGKEFRFVLSELEIQLWRQGGMSRAFATWGKGLLSKMTSPVKGKKANLERPKKDGLDW